MTQCNRDACIGKCNTDRHRHATKTEMGTARRTIISMQSQNSFSDQEEHGSHLAVDVGELHVGERRAVHHHPARHERLGEGGELWELRPEEDVRHDRKAKEEGDEHEQEVVQVRETLLHRLVDDLRDASPHALPLRQTQRFHTHALSPLSRAGCCRCER
eukprot:3941507-Rhodomonas_salina.1